MKNLKLLTLFVTFIFTAVTSVSAQTLNLTANGQDVHNTTTTLAVFTAPEWASWLTTGAVQQNVVPFKGCDANCLATINQQGAKFANKVVTRQMVITNRNNHIFAPGVLTDKLVPSALTKFATTLSVADVDFQGNSIREMVLTFNKAAGTYDYDYLVHNSVNVKSCIVSTQNGQPYISADPLCGQPFDSATMMMLINGQAKLVQASGPNNPNTPGPASAGTTLTFEQLLVLAKTLQATNVIYAGNGNGNVTLPGGGTNPISQTSPFGQGWTPVQPFTPPTPSPNVIQQGGGGQGGQNQGGSGNGTACGNCGSGYQLTQADVALGQKQGQTMIAQNAQTNRLLKTGNVINGISMGLHIVQTGFEVADDFGAFNKFKVAPVFNQFNSTTTGNTTVDAGGNPVSWNNGGGLGNCPDGYHSDGTQCIIN